ncbi:hypothetical protein PTKIN_Ptkin12aG0007400 [Pterospermum kingtungense]
MESRPYCLKLLCISIVATLIFIRCDARFMVHAWKHQDPELQKSSPFSELINKLKFTNHVFSNADPYTLNSPFYLPPFEPLSPLPQPDRSPPYNQYPPFTPQSPPPPVSYGLITPPSPPPPGYTHSPPANPPDHGVSVSPPGFFSSPPKHAPTPPKHAPGQPIYPAPPHKGSKSGVWCVAKPTVPDSIIQAAMDYACGSGADCKSIQPNGACFQPNTMIAHASFAFNNYWQNTKGTGGTCDFGGTAMLVTVDPSFDKCQFSYNA